MTLETRKQKTGVGKCLGISDIRTLISGLRGFTLVETIIIIAFSAVMMLAIATLVYNFNKISVYGDTSAKSSGSARALMREIESLVTPSRAVLQTYTFSGSARTSSSNTLVLEIPSINSSGNVIPNVSDYAAFYTSGTNAYRILETNASSRRQSGTKLLSTTVNTLTFSYDNVDFPAVSTVTADIQTQAYAKQEVLSAHLREQIRLRNH